MSKTNKKVLIIGGGGFIGTNIAKFLLNKGNYHIDIADNFERNKENFKNLELESYGASNIQLINKDFTKLSSYDYLDDNYDYVYHLAAIVGVDKVNSMPEEVLRINSALILNALEWLNSISCEKVLYASTSEVYAGSVEVFGSSVPTDENVSLSIQDIKHPRYTYAVSKMLGEAVFINYARKVSCKAVIVRYHNVFGPNMGFRHVIPHLVERFLQKEEPFLVYGHDQTRAFNYIDDAVKGTVLAAEKGKSGEIYHLGSEQEISIEELTKYVGSILKFKGNYQMAPTFPGSVSRRCPNIDKAKSELGYYWQTDWKVGVANTVEWYIREISKNKNQFESFYDQYGIQNTAS